MFTSKSKLQEFTEEYIKLLEKFPEITVYSVDNQEHPRAYHHVVDKNGNVVRYFQMNLPRNFEESTL